MVRLIPPEIREYLCSKAEMKVFALFKNDPESDDWLVFHSLALSRNKARPYGEIDFVVLIPRKGIVCLEVKGGGISCANGEWYTRDGAGVSNKLKKSPFKQASDSMFMLREKIEENFSPSREILEIPTGYMVLFPDCNCPPLTPEYNREEVADAADLDSEPVSKLIVRYADRVLKGRQKHGQRLPDQTGMKSLRQFLRPDFDCPISLAAQISSTEKSIEQFTSEQLERLDDFEQNDRCLFLGAAGTGKTLLAAEFARRAATRGESVLFLCFNRILGQWLEMQTPGIRTGSFFSVLRKTIMKSKYREEFLKMASQPGEGSNKYDEMFPVYGRLAIQDLEEQFDVLVMDEAQDLFTEPILEVCDEWLKGNLSEGRWAIFGDFTGQQIYRKDSSSRDTIDLFSSGYTVGSLRRNCRNTRNIAEAAIRAGKFARSPYHEKMADGPAVSYKYWKLREEQKVEVEAFSEKLLTDGVKGGDIVVLGRYGLENSCLRNTSELAGKQLVEITSIEQLTEKNDCIKYSTAWSYKGLEAPAVIVVDFDRTGYEESPSLLYVAMSRARSYLRVLASSDLRKELSN